MTQVGNRQNYLLSARGAGVARTTSRRLSTIVTVVLHGLVAFSLVTACAVACADSAVEMQVQFDAFPGAQQRDETSYDFEQYDLALTAPTRGADGFRSEQTKNIEGRIQRQIFFIEGNASSPLEVFTNYRDALLGKGFEILYECRRKDCGSKSSTWSRQLDSTMATNVDTDHQFYLAARLGAPQTYVALFVKGQFGGLGTEYLFDQIEPQAMETGRVAISVDDMMASLDRTGKVAIYDIYFDTGKATLTNQSAPVLGDIVTLLNKRPGLALYVVGHTDDTGKLEFNQTLSQRRAQAVVTDLVKRGVTATRLTPFGAGPFAPAASNRNDAGRATNRRVELVERLPPDGG